MIPKSLRARLLAVVVAALVCAPLVTVVSVSAYGALAARGNPRAFAFISKQRAGDPVARWNPCARIGYRVNARQGGPGALADTREALARIRQVTGLRFVYRGSTRIIPGGVGGNRYPRDTRLVVSWARPAQTRWLDAAGVAGQGGPSWVEWTTDGGRTRAMITRGFVVLNARVDLGGGFGGGVHNGWVGTRGQLLMHELGHAVGLDHPRQDDRWEIMYRTMTEKRAVWGRGDRNGLRRVGEARGCLRPPRFSARMRTTGVPGTGPRTESAHRR
jgi:Peptidase M66